MLRALTIKNFRGFRELKIEPLARVNLIAGKNNVGKTSVLEALYLLFANKSQFYQSPSAFRSHQEKVSGQPDDQEKTDNFKSFWKWVPHREETICRIQIEAINTNNNTFVVELDEQCITSSVENLTFHYSRDGDKQISRAVIAHFDSIEPVSSWPRMSICSTHHTQPTEDADLLNSLVLKKKRKTLIDVLKVIDPRLEDLQYLKIGSEPLVYVDVGLKELIPLTQLGQGFARLFSFFSEMLVENAKIILIDEIENGIHHSALIDVWKGIAQIAVKEDLQVFATTHSWECIEAAHEVFREREQYDFALHRLQLVKGEIQVVSHDQKMIEVAEKAELEIR